MNIDMEMREIALADLKTNWNIRSRNLETELDELAESIRVNGLLEPIVVCPAAEMNRYEIIAGQRRFLAHIRIGKESILAIVRERIDRHTARVLSVTENMIRRDLETKDLIDVCTELYKKYGSIKVVSEETGLPYNKVSQYVKYPCLITELKRLVDGGMKLETALRAQDAASVYGVTNVEEAIKMAHSMQPKSGAQQKKIVETRKENPEMTADEVIENSEKRERVTKIVVTISSHVHGSLHDYATYEGTTQEDAACGFIEEGLSKKGFMRNPK